MLFISKGEKVACFSFGGALQYILSISYHSLSGKKKSAIRRQKSIWESGGRSAAAVWLIQVDSLWCVSIKAFTEAQHRGLPKAHQRVAYFISQVENVLRKRGRGNSGEVSESNSAIVPIADPNTSVTVVAAAHNKSPNRRSRALN